MDRNATERGYAGGKDAQGVVGMGLIVPIWKVKCDVHDPRKYRGITLLDQIARVVVGEGSSEMFGVKIVLKQSSVLSKLLFKAVLDLISGKTVMKDAMKKRLYADDLALVANGK